MRADPSACRRTRSVAPPTPGEWAEAPSVQRGDDEGAARAERGRAPRAGPAGRRAGSAPRGHALDRSPAAPRRSHDRRALDAWPRAARPRQRGDHLRARWRATHPQPPPPAHARQRAGAVHGDGLVALCLPRLEQPLHGRIETGQGFVMALLAGVGPSQPAEIARMHGRPGATAPSDRRQLQREHPQAAMPSRPHPGGCARAHRAIACRGHAADSRGSGPAPSSRRGRDRGGRRRSRPRPKPAGRRAGDASTTHAPAAAGRGALRTRGGLRPYSR